jgi:hypothetical protein
MFSDLPKEIQRDAKRAYRQFQPGTSRPSSSKNWKAKKAFIRFASAWITARWPSETKIESFGIGSAATQSTTE